MGETKSAVGSSEPEVLLDKVLFYLSVHIAALYGFYLIFTLQVHYLSLIYVIVNYVLALITFQTIIALYLNQKCILTVGFHLVLIFAQTRSGYNSIYEWVQENYLHRKYKNTRSDPFNKSYMSWLWQKEDEEVTKKKNELSFGVLDESFYITSQRSYYTTLFVIVGIVLPIVVPVLLWGESLTNAVFVCLAFRYVIGLHYPWLMNAGENGLIYPFSSEFSRNLVCKLAQYLHDANHFRFVTRKFD